MAGKPWFEVHWERDGIGWIQEPLVKSFMIEGERDVAILDTGMGVGDFAAIVASASSREPLVVQTHGHWDHVGSSYAFERVLIHPNDADDLRAGVENAALLGAIERFMGGEHDLPEEFDRTTAHIPGVEPTGMLHEGDRIDLGSRVLEVYETPGHSPGGVTLLDRSARALFTGDAVNLGRMLLCLPGSDPRAYRTTLTKIVELAEAADQIFICHGDPITPDELRDYQAAFEQLWTGVTTPSRESMLIGVEHVTADIHDVGIYRFLVPADAIAVE
ncbi:MAG: MBL fold metallo-hydrolase [Chloroflexota bacterium]|nr:MBL fold metallo-hydrolase [Chloroflexota bacterium]